MFKKFKDRLNEVSEEVKRDPRFQSGLASVGKIASDTLSNIGSGENKGLTPSASQQVINGSKY